MDTHVSNRPAGGGAEPVYLTINGQEVAAQANETILKCARRYGLYIPTLCEMDDIDHTPGTCRVCLVEIEGRAGTPASVKTCTRTGCPEAR